MRRERGGNRVCYQANPAFPIFPELRSIFVKTIGLAGQVRAALVAFLYSIDVAFIYGSIARGERTASSDINLMIIGSVGLADLAMPLRELEQTLAIPVNVVVHSVLEFVTKWKQQNHSLRTALREPRIFLKGSDDELANTIGGPEDQGSHDEKTRA